MRLILAVILCSIGLSAQTVYQLPLWTGKTYTWPRLGSSFTVVNNVVEVVLPPSTTVRRVYGSVLVASGNVYPLPAGSRNVAVWLNGIRVAPGVDYTISTDQISPIVPWVGNNIVLVDYDQP